MSQHEVLVTLRTTEYTLCAVPLTYPDWQLWAVTVEWRDLDAGSEMFAVKYRSQCLDKDGNWSTEPIPSSRTGPWLSAFRHDEKTALRLAATASLTVTCNGRTAAEYMSWFDQQRDPAAVGGRS